MSKAFNIKFFLKSLKEITGEGIEEFYSDNYKKENSDSIAEKDCYSDGKPKLFLKIIEFLSGLESSFKIEKRHESIKQLMNSLAENNSHFQKLIAREYSKVVFLFLLKFLTLYYKKLFLYSNYSN